MVLSLLKFKINFKPPIMRSKRFYIFMYNLSKVILKALKNKNRLFKIQYTLFKYPNALKKTTYIINDIFLIYRWF